MPVQPGEYKVQKVKGGHEVVNAITGVKHSLKTSKQNALSQVRLLYAVGHGWEPSHTPTRRHP